MAVLAKSLGFVAVMAAVVIFIYYTTWAVYLVSSFRMAYDFFTSFFVSLLAICGTRITSTGFFLGQAVCYHPSMLRTSDRTHSNSRLYSSCDTQGKCKKETEVIPVASFQARCTVCASVICIFVSN
jgi:hypothetical protein